MPDEPLDQGTLTTRLDAQDHLLRALAVTQSEHGTQLRKLAADQARMAEGLERLDERQERLDERQERTTLTIERVEAGIRTIIGLLEQGG